MVVTFSLSFVYVKLLFSSLFSVKKRKNSLAQPTQRFDIFVLLYLHVNIFFIFYKPFPKINTTLR